MNDMAPIGTKLQPDVLTLARALSLDVHLPSDANRMRMIGAVELARSCAKI